MSLAGLKKKPAKAKRVVGLDLNSSKMAFSIFDDGSLVEFGEVQFPGANVFERLISANEIVSALRGRVDADKIVFEQAIYVNNQKTVVILAYMYGAIVSALAKRGNIVEAIGPTEWGKKIGNNGVSRADREKFKKNNPGKSKSWYDTQFREMRKQITKDWVESALGVDTSNLNDDICDAIAIGFTASSKE